VARIRLLPDYYPLPSQRQFHDAGPLPITPDTAPGRIKFRAYVGGIGSGKSKANVAEGLRWAASYPGCSGIMVSPTYQQLKKTILVEFLSECRKAKGFLTRFNRSDWVAEFINGSTIWFGYAENPDSLRGPNLSWFSFDEAGQVQDDGMAFQVLQGRTRDPRFPMAGWITTTPRGKNWLWRFFEAHQDPNGDPLEDAAEYALFRCRTEENDNLDPSYVRSLRGSYVGQFAAQELGGEFVAFEGVIYPGLAEQIGEIPPGVRVLRARAGVDWGWTNPGVIVVCKLLSNGTLCITREEYATERPVEAQGEIEDWIKVAKRIQVEDRIETWYCDPSEPDNIAAFQRHGLHAVPADNAVIPGISAVSAAQAAGLTISARCPRLRSELGAYRWKQGRDGKIRNDEPLKEGDHGPDAVRYVVPTYVETGGGGAAAMIRT
jgi:phage terminase large subunit